jgi:hypothetical protein
MGRKGEAMGIRFKAVAGLGLSAALLVLATTLSGRAGGGEGCGGGADAPELAQRGQASLATQTLGPFYPYSSSWARHQSTFHFYVVSPGGPKLVANLQIYPMPGMTWPQRFLVRHFDPDENLQLWRFVDPTSTNPAWAPDANALFDGTVRPIDLGAAGVHQIRVTFPRLIESNVSLQIPSQPGVRWGFSAGNGVISSRFYSNGAFSGASSGLPQTLYAWAPVHRHAPMRLRAREVDGSGPISITDLTTGQAVTLSNMTSPSTQEGVPQQVLTIPPHPTQEGHVLRFDLPADWVFKLEGFPIILSPTPEAAQAIHGSVERLPSGGLVAHKFQLQLAELLPQVLAGAGDRATLHAMGSGNYPAQQPSCVTPANGDDVHRNAAMLLNYGPLRQIRWALAEYKTCDNTGNACVTARECQVCPSSGNCVYGNCSGVSRGPTQVTDPSSHWAGSIGVPLLLRQRCNLAGSASATQCANGSACVASAASGGDVYQEFDGHCAPFDQSLDRWDTLRTMRFDPYPIYGARPHAALYAGASLDYGGVASSLIIGATLDHPCNPYGPSRPQSSGLFYRGVAAALVDALTITEGEHFAGTGAEGTNWPTVTAFPIVQKTLTTYHEAAPHLLSQMPQLVDGQALGQRVKQLWTEAMRRLVERFVVDEAWTAANQATHGLVALELFYQGSQLSDYLALTRHFGARLIADRQDPAGFFHEAGGLDATYEGMAHWHLGLYTRLTENDPGGVDQAIKSALRQSYDFYNHTVAPEPDGSPLGGFNFSHRTALGAFAEQWDGATGIVTDMAEVAVWTRAGLRWPGLATMSARLADWANNYDFGGDSLTTQGLNLSMELWRYYSSSLAKGSTLPAERAPFTKKFDDDLVAVKTETYFASVYIGHPAPNAAYWGQQLASTGDFHYPLPEESGDKLLTNHSRIQPFVGGGLTSYWTKDFGHAVIGTNLSPLMHHGLVGTRYESGNANGRRVWEHYKNNTATWQTPQILDIAGELEEAQLTYTRRYAFSNDALHVYLTIRPKSPLIVDAKSGVYSLKDLYENIPVPVCTAGGRAACQALDAAYASVKSAGSRVLRTTGLLANGTFQASKLYIADYDGRGVTLDFHGTRTVRVVQDGLRFRYARATGGKELRIGQIMIPLKTTWAAGESQTIHYSLRAGVALPTPSK